MKIFKYFLFLIFAIIIWYLLYGFDDSKPTVSIDNEVKSDIIARHSIEIKTPKAKKKVINFTEKLAPETVISEPDIHLSYLQAYRNIDYFQKCNSIITDINNNISPLIKFKKDSSLDYFDFSNESEKQATTLQLQYFSDFTERCRSFIKDDNETYFETIRRLKTILNEIEPNTDEEKDLVSGIELLKQLFALQKLMRSTQTSHSKLDDETLNNIKQEIKNTLKIISEYKANPDWQTNHQIQNAIQDLTNKIYQLNDKINQNRVSNTDTEEKQNIENQLVEHKTKMVDFLKKNKSPDVLLLYARYIFKPDYQNNNPIISDMKRELNTYDRSLMLNLYNVGIKLAACALNYPCDDQSHFILDYCIRGFHNMSNYPDACGMTLEDFYFNHYLGPNQLEDVSKYLNYILEHYAK